MHRPKKGNVVRYVVASDIEKAFRMLAQELYGLNPAKDADKEELQRWSSHSIRVDACTLLHAARYDPTYIQFLLRWDSNAFMKYLRNLVTISKKHTADITAAMAVPHFVA